MNTKEILRTAFIITGILGLLYLGITALTMSIAGWTWEAAQEKSGFILLTILPPIFAFGLISLAITYVYRYLPDAWLRSFGGTLVGIVTGFMLTTGVVGPIISGIGLLNYCTIDCYSWTETVFLFLLFICLSIVVALLPVIVSNLRNKKRSSD